MDMSWTSHGQPRTLVAALQARKVGERPAQGHNRLERTTGFEPATLTLAR